MLSARVAYTNAGLALRRSACSAVNSISWLIVSISGIAARWFVATIDRARQPASAWLQARRAFLGRQRIAAQRAEHDFRDQNGPEHAKPHPLGTPDPSAASNRMKNGSGGSVGDAREVGADLAAGCTDPRPCSPAIPSARSARYAGSDSRRRQRDELGLDAPDLLDQRADRPHVHQGAAHEIPIGKAHRIGLDSARARIARRRLPARSAAGYRVVVSGPLSCGPMRRLRFGSAVADARRNSTTGSRSMCGRAACLRLARRSPVRSPGSAENGVPG